MTLKQSEGEPGRGATATVIAGSVAAALMLVSVVLGFTMALAASPSQAATVPTLYAASALSFALAGGALALFFFGVARAVLRSQALPKWLGIYAFVTGFLCVIAIVSPFFAIRALQRGNRSIRSLVVVRRIRRVVAVGQRHDAGGPAKEEKEPDPPAEDPSLSTGIEGENA